MLPAGLRNKFVLQHRFDHKNLLRLKAGSMNNIAFINGNILPMDGRKRYSAILACNGKIECVGSDDEIADIAKEKQVDIIDLKGKTVVPGLHDCHAHLSLTGFDAQGINMYDAADIGEVLSKLAEADNSLPKGKWLYGQRLDEGLLAEKRPPLMDELDQFDRPVFISDRGGHYVLVNGAAFKALHVDENMRGVRKYDDGRPNGRLQDEANKYARNAYPRTREDFYEAMRWTAEEAVKKGITTIHAQEVFAPSDPAADVLLEHQDDFPVDFKIYWCMMPEYDDPRCKKTGILGGDILLDGSIGSRTAAFFEPYCDGDGCGYLNYPDETVNNFVEAAVVRGLEISFHVIGEKGIWQALNTYERALELHPEKKDEAKLRLEHFGWPTPEDLKRAAKLNVRISTQPAFTYLRGGPESIYRSRLGETREKAGYSLREMLDVGLCVGGGSDSDVTPLDSILGMHAAVNQPYPENSVTPYEALRMYTSEAAKCGWEDDIKGKLIPGMQADMTILDKDPLAIEPTKIKDIKVIGTVRKGTVVYDNGI